MASSCAICRKNMKNKNIKLFRAPADELKRQRWNESCGLILNKNSRICEKHFLRSDFINPPRDPMAAKSRLMPGAVPSVLCGSALREDEIDCRLKPEKKTEFPIDLNEIKQQVTIEPLIIETQRIRLDNIQSFCRTCLTSISQHTVGNGLIFNVHKTKDLAKWITEYTQLKVERNDGYPKYSCQECYNKFENFNEFRTTCTESMLLLESVLNSNKSGEKDPIQLDTDTSSLLCEDECVSSEKGEFIAEDEIIDPAEWWKLEIRRDDGVEIDKTDTEENEEVVEIKQENKVLPGTTSQEHVEQKLESHAKFDFKSCSDEFFPDTTEFLETGNFSEDKPEFSNFINLKDSFPQNSPNSLSIPNTNIKMQSKKQPAIRFECEICQRRCMSEDNLAAHLRGHQGLKPYKCSHCERSYTRVTLLRRHIIASHEDNKELFNCTFKGCDQQFHLLQSLRKHYRVKHLKGVTDKLEPTPLHICDVCGLTFKTNYQLNDHSYRHRPKEEYPYKCNKCDKCFVRKKFFEEHQMRHDGIKNHVCPYCGQRKTTLHELNTHMNYHTKTKQWPCPLCPRVFNRSFNLTLHDRVFHKKIRNYKCNQCGQCFGKLENLKNHEMRHTGERPRECKLCGKRFIQISTLQNHMKTHEKPVRLFKCNHCDQTFAHSNTLKNHELIHTGEKPHECKICGKCFRQLSALRYHLKWHIREEYRSSTEGKSTGRNQRKKHTILKEEQSENTFSSVITAVTTEVNQDVHIDLK